MKKCYVNFFKDALNKRAVTLRLQLDESNVSTLIKFEYQSSRLKINESLKKQTWFPSPLYKVRQTSEMKVKFMWKCD